MAFRRRFRRARAPVARRARYRRATFRRRRFRKPRRRSGNLTFDCVLSTNIEIDKDHKLFNVGCMLDDFNEAKRLWDNFEAYRIWSLKVKIIPLFNVANPETPVPIVVSAPFHRPAPDLDANGILSLDRSRTHRGTSKIQRSFVPTVLSAVRTNSNPDNNNLVKTSWRPRIELSGGSSTKVRHYGGLIYFDAQFGKVPYAKPRQYECQIIAKVTMYTQKGFNN